MNALPAPAASSESAAALLSVSELTVRFPSDDGLVRAVDGVSFYLHRGETLAIVGESGSGKTVTAMAILGLLTKRAQVAGSVVFDGESLLGRPAKELRRIRGARIAMVFQDALTALNPVFTVGNQIMEAIAVHRDAPKRELRERAIELLDLVGIPNPTARVGQYPHEYSGGMRQRAMIAMAISNEPDVLIADEPTTALDVTIQAQVLDTITRVQERTNSAIILITHDLGVVAGIADRVLVMYAGRPVEQGDIDDVFYGGRHPYTLGLLASLPRLDRRLDATTRLYRIKGQPPSLVFVPPGCAFHPRCAAAQVPGRCSQEVPVLHEVGPGHLSACHRAMELDREGLLLGDAR